MWFYLFVIPAIHKGKIKPKKLQALVSSLQPADKFLGGKFLKRRLVGVKVLQEEKEPKEDSQVLVGAVTVCFSPPEEVPLLAAIDKLSAFSFYLLWQ